MEFREYCKYRYFEFFAGLFWTLFLPVAIAVIILKCGGQAEAIVAYILIGILWLAAIRIFAEGIEGIINNGKRALVLNENSFDVLLHFKKKSQWRTVNYADICEFAFVSYGTRKNKISGKYEIKKHSCGSLCFALKDNKNMVYDIVIYDAMPAAEYIIGLLDESQIDKSHNELTKDGRHTPKG